MSCLRGVMWLRWQWFNPGCRRIFTSCCRIPCPASPPVPSSCPQGSSVSSPPSSCQSPALCRPVASRPLCEKRGKKLSYSSDCTVREASILLKHTLGHPTGSNHNLLSKGISVLQHLQMSKRFWMCGIWRLTWTLRCVSWPQWPVPLSFSRPPGLVFPPQWSSCCSPSGHQDPF